VGLSSRISDRGLEEVMGHSTKVERRVAIIASATTDVVAGDVRVTVPEMVFDVARRAVADSGLVRSEIDVTMSGSSDILEGRAFNFAYALEAMGAHPPTEESHLEMDGAFAAYYAWLKILSGEARSALVIAFAKCSEGSLHHVLNTQLDPFFLAPLGLDRTASAALQADAYLARTGTSIGALDEVARRARKRAADNEGLRALLAEEIGDRPVASPLWARHCARTADAAAAIVLAEEDLARRVSDRPVWIRGADHRIESGSLCDRDLGRSTSAELAMRRALEIAGWGRADADFDVAELAAPFAHQVLMLKEALALSDRVAIDPSGGALAADPVMVTGLLRLRECALQLGDEAGPRQVAGARRAIAHASQGHALQQNLVWLLESER
jgi:acetyl-CoA acetyltransferase